jgi:hypothetical protein
MIRGYCFWIDHLTPEDLISWYPPQKPDVTEEKCMGPKSANKIIWLLLRIH